MTTKRPQYCDLMLDPVENQKLLMKLRRTSVLVDRFFAMWQRGDFPSYEAMLTALVVHQGQYLDRLFGMEFDRVLRRST